MLGHFSKNNYIRFWGTCMFMDDSTVSRQTLAGWHYSNKQLLRFVTD